MRSIKKHHRYKRRLNKKSRKEGEEKEPIKDINHSMAEEIVKHTKISTCAKNHLAANL